MTPNWAIAVIGFVLASIAIWTLGQLRSPLRTVHGPFLARCTSLWYAWNVRQGSFHKVNMELHKKYGRVVRYGPNRYSINDPTAVKTIYGLGNPFPKSSWYSTWSSPGQWSLFTDQVVWRHAHDRKMYQATYAMSSLMHYEAFVDECADLFARRLSELSAANASVDMRHWFQCYAFDVIGMITYAKRLGFLDRGEDVGNVISALDDHLCYASVVGVIPSLHRYLVPLRNYFAGSRGAGRAYVVNFTQDRIREAQANPKAAPDLEAEAATQDFLSKFLAKRAADPENFTSIHVLLGCVSNMVAGSDTTAISLSAVLYYLLKNPTCMQKLQHEVDTCAANGELSPNPTFKESQQMPYLQAVIKEALRLHPATGLPLERVVPKGGATIAGHFFPEDTIVGINTWVAHRDQEVWGVDADNFVPERWLESDADRLSAMNRQWMAFGLGSRTCIGRHISMLEMCKLIPRLIRDFTFELDGALSHEEWHTSDYWFVKPLDFNVRVKLRT